jgi:hypothetical protein
MNRLQLIRREAWTEFQFGLRSGVVALIFIGLTAYLLMVLTNAGYLKDMGAVEVPRNAPSLVYMMTAGDSFFLFFAWAWVFAQPIVRDRNALLHEVVLTAPISLRALLFGRFLGALGVGLLLSMSQILGFLLAPLLEVLGLVPVGSIGPTPWAALGWAFLIFSLPSTLGTGALYFLATLKTRSIVGPFTASAALIFVWMFAMLVMSEGGVQTGLAGVLDPSCFADVNLANLSWTPIEKATLLYPLTTPLLINRLLWCVLPVVVLMVVVFNINREYLVLERPTVHSKKNSAGKDLAIHSQPTSKLSNLSFHLNCKWWRALKAETGWQLKLLFSKKSIWIMLGGLVLMNIGAAYTHGINNIDGPFEARPEFTGPLLAKVMYLVIAFIAAALVGQILRRDHKAGIVEMIDATAAPTWVSLLSRVATILTASITLLLTPAIACMVVAVLSTPQAFSVATPLMFQLAVYGPGLIELVAVNFVIHYLIRSNGLAYALSMLATFILIVNHEAKLVTYPLFEFGVPAHVDYSMLTGWSQWSLRLLLGDLYKISFVALLIALAAWVQVRGLDSRLAKGGQLLLSRLRGPIGIAIAGSVSLCVALYLILDNQFTSQGGYQSRSAEMTMDAKWEQRWLPLATAFAVDGGELVLHVDTQRSQIQGHWQLRNVSAANNLLHLELPQWLDQLTATANGVTATIEQDDEHATVALNECSAGGCDVQLQFTVTPRGWSTEGEQHWISSSGIWAHAALLAPRLGFDQDRRLRSPRERRLHGLASDLHVIDSRALSSVSGIAPDGVWLVKLVIDNRPQPDAIINSTLDFIVQASAQGEQRLFGSLTVVSDITRAVQATQVADDVKSMQACVATRLGIAPRIDLVAQLPRGMGSSAIANGTLLLAEAPHWDVVEQGSGRWQRQATIAALLAQQTLIEYTTLRQGEGSRAFILGVSGALGRTCVADTAGIKALQVLLNRDSERIAQALGSSVTPVAAVLFDSPDKWLKEYVSPAYLSFVAQRSSDDFKSLIAAINKHGAVTKAFDEVLGAHTAALYLGLPQSFDIRIDEQANTIHAVREQWLSGGWKPITRHNTDTLLELSPRDQRIHAKPMSIDEPPKAMSLLLDNWMGFERTPIDNLSTR